MMDNVFETYVVTGPIIDLTKVTKFIGTNDKKNKVFIPVPQAFFKSILIENNRGKFYMWNFIMENSDKKLEEDLDKYQVSTKEVELMAGIDLWSNLQGEWIDWEKSNVRSMW